MQRFLLGICALLLIGTGAGIAAAQWYGGAVSLKTTSAILIRAGVILAVVWLAIPQLAQILSKYPPWLAAAAIVATLILAARPRTYVFILPLLLILAALQFVGWLMQPPGKSK